LPSFSDSCIVSNAFHKISLSEFFDIGNKNPNLLNTLINELKSLDEQTLVRFYDIAAKLNNILYDKII